MPIERILDIIAAVFGFVRKQDLRKQKARVGIILGSFLMAGIAYYHLCDRFAPSWNCIRRARHAIEGNEYRIYSGGTGGFYIKVGARIEAGKGGLVSDLEIKNEPGTPQDNIKQVIEDGFALGLIQEDSLAESGPAREQVRAIAPLYTERLHILYRREKYEQIRVADDPLVPRLALDSHEATRKFFAKSKVRISSKDSASGNLPLAGRILQLCGLDVGEIVPKSIGASVDLMEDGKIDVVFIMASAPAPAVKDLLSKPGSRTKIGLMSLDPGIVGELNGTLGRDYRLSSLNRIYGRAYGSPATISARAMLFASRNVPSYVLGHAAKVITAWREDESKARADANGDAQASGHHPLQELDLIDSVVSQSRSLWGDRIQTWGLSLAAVLVLTVLTVRFITLVASSINEIRYSREITEVYNSCLPDNYELEAAAEGLPLPRILGDDRKTIESLVLGISKLLELAKSVRGDYEKGALSISHQFHLMTNLYQVKEICQRQLARRIESHVHSGGDLSLEDLRTWFIGGYLLREHYRDLHQLFEEPEPARHSGGEAAPPGEVIETTQDELEFYETVADICGTVVDRRSVRYKDGPKWFTVYYRVTGEVIALFEDGAQPGMVVPLPRATVESLAPGYPKEKLRTERRQTRIQLSDPRDVLQLGPVILRALEVAQEAATET